MANKTLTANVKLNTSQAEKSLATLSKKINNINKALNKTKTSNLEKQLSRAGTQATKLRTKLGKVNSTLSKTSSTANRVKTALTNAGSKLSNIGSRTQAWASAQRRVNNNLKSGNSLLGTIGTKLKGLAATYLGMQSAKLAIDTSDTITSSKNLMNNLDGGSPEATEKAMDKIYAAAQRSRSSYTGMMSNVGKTMTLAGDSFQNNIDNAIRFQEIMAKAYTVGGASATEAHTSMYQLVQALGSGILQGDELRSVREGAPIAYKEIEKFAQGVFDTEESLKDMASQGVITSDIIVAAIMNAEDKINKSFNNTSITFGQAWDQIKNMAVQAFKPALDSLNKMLNSDAGKSMIEGIGKALVVLGNILTWTINGLASFFNWCAENWEWLKYVIGGVLLFIIALLIKQAAIAIWNALVNIAAYIKQYWALMLIVAGIMAILYFYEIWRQGTINTVEFICYCLLVVAAMFIVLAIVSLGWIGVIIAAVIALVALILLYFSEVCGAIYVGVQAIVNAWFWCGNLILGVWEWCCAAVGNGIKWIGNVFWGCVNWISALWHNCVAGVVNVAMGLWNSIKAIAQNIGIAFENAWIGAQNMFWSFIQSCLEGVKFLEPAINAIAKAFGHEGFTLSGVIDDVAGKQQEYKSFVSVGDAWNTGMKTMEYKDLGDAWSSGMSTYEYKDLGDAWNKGWNTYDAFESGWASDAYNTGYDWGQGVEDSINEWGSQWQTKAGDSSYGGWGTDLTDMLGLNGNGLPNPTDPAYSLDGGYDPTGADNDIKNGLKKLGNIEDDADSIKDSMDLKDDDLEYLRKLAEMEWRNEFTTAEIKVDMTNHNTVNGERDLDGIVSYLSDVLREEMTNVAYGVHY